MSTSFNFVDLAFIAFALIFVITAFLRGFVKEVFSLTVWALSITLAYVLAPYVSKALSSYSDSKLVIDISSRMLIFVTFFIIFSISTSGLRDALKEKMPKIFDRSLGVLFGIVKTLLVFGLLYSVTIQATAFVSGKKLEDGKQEAPSWMKEAKSYNILKMSGEVLNPLAKQLFDGVAKNFKQVLPPQPEDLDSKIDELMDKKDQIDDGLDPMKESAQKAVDNKAGYNKKDIEKMNRLIEIIDK